MKGKTYSLKKARSSPDPETMPVPKKYNSQNLPGFAQEVANYSVIYKPYLLFPESQSICHLPFNIANIHFPQILKGHQQ